MVGAAYFFFLLLVFFLAIFFGILHTPCNTPHFSQRAVASTAKICEIDSLQRCYPSPTMLRSPPIAGVYRDVASRVCAFYQGGCKARSTRNTGSRAQGYPARRGPSNPAGCRASWCSGAPSFPISQLPEELRCPPETIYGSLFVISQLNCSSGVDHGNR
jgi:hypothetical protein